MFLERRLCRIWGNGAMLDASSFGDDARCGAVAQIADGAALGDLPPTRESWVQRLSDHGYQRAPGACRGHPLPRRGEPTLSCGTCGRSAGPEGNANENRKTCGTGSQTAPKALI